MRKRENGGYCISRYPLTHSACRARTERGAEAEKPDERLCCVCSAASLRRLSTCIFSACGNLRRCHRRRGRRSRGGEKKKKTRLIVMLNLRVNDTITMPTSAIAMETGFYCIDRLKKPPPPLKQVKCAVCTQLLPCVEPFLQLILFSSDQRTRPELKQHLTVQNRS